MLGGVFENFRNICLKIHKLNPAHFLLAPGLVWQVALKLTNIDMLLMVEKVSQAEYVTLTYIYRYVKANNKYMKKV